MLPSELICRVFESATDFSTVVALAQTARVFYDTWREYPTAICRAVIPHAILNLDDAQQLLDMQQEAEATSEMECDQKQKSIVRAKRLLSNARCASAASKEWVHNSRFGAYFEREVRPREIARFEHAFYCVWAIGIMGTTPHLQHEASAFLDNCSPRELCRLEEQAQFSYAYDKEFFESLGLAFNGEVWECARDLVPERWQEVGRNRWWGSMRVPMRTTFVGFYAFYDETQQYLERIPDEVDSTFWDRTD
ncbi:uncharacterized protein EKO05_0000733 [Ascochyta rabiei]|nr:uncharacterized protein EKO05_0000733 [Ascochyta rabiei]UPX10061.1 hypothetical protein EKO05_0000733 [Ascochyta rabiei]